MGLSFRTRPSDSSWISSVWTCTSEDITTMTAIASETWGLVFWQEEGAPQAAVVGPETRTGSAPVPHEANFVGIQFAVGTALRFVDTCSLVDAGIALPDVRRTSFWLDGRRWRTPTADDAEGLVEHLVRHGVLVRDEIVTDVRRGGRPPLNPRTVERRFRASTGLSRGAIDQIERVRTAATLLANGAVVDDVVHALGYYDEPHLARMLRRYVGRSAQQLRTGDRGSLALDAGHLTTSYSSLVTPFE